MKNWSQKLTYFASGLGVSLSLGGFAFYPWDAANDPSRIGENYETVFEKLPTENSLSRVPWSGPFFQYVRGGFQVLHFASDRVQQVPIEQRPLYTSSELLRMSRAQLVSLLSPTEILDILNGNTDPSNRERFYRITRAERAELAAMGRTYTPQGWEGNCQGWAPASIAYGEMSWTHIPVPLSESGQQIGTLNFPLSPYHWKALLTRFYGRYVAEYEKKYGSMEKIVGGTCGGGETIGQCAGTNAGSFHILIANEIRPGKIGLIGDMSPGDEIWNHPIYRYRISKQRSGLPLSAGAAKNAVSEVEIELELTFQNEFPANQVFRDELGDQGNYQYLKLRRLSYRLELDSSGRIVGGRWLRGSIPDRLWKLPRYKLTGDYSVLAPYVPHSETAKRGDR